MGQLICVGLGPNSFHHIVEITNFCMKKFHRETWLILGLNSLKIETLAYGLLVLRSFHRETVSYKMGCFEIAAY